MRKATYVELKGEFEFAINQSGLDYHDKEEKEYAVEDFKKKFEEFLEVCDRFGFVSFDYDLDKIDVFEGE